MAAASGIFAGWIRAGSDRNRCCCRTEQSRACNKVSPYSGDTIGGLLDGAHDVNK